MGRQVLFITQCESISMSTDGYPGKEVQTQALPTSSYHLYLLHRCPFYPTSSTSVAEPTLLCNLSFPSFYLEFIGRNWSCVHPKCKGYWEM